MTVSAKPGERAASNGAGSKGVTSNGAAGNGELAELQRRLAAAEARIAAEVAAREEQEALARTMARAARSEAAEGEALARDAAQLRSLLQAQQDEHAAAKRALERQRADFQRLIDEEVGKRLAPALERRLADTQARWDADRKQERDRLAEKWKREAEQRLEAAEAEWRRQHDSALAEAANALKNEHGQLFAAARKEWEEEHDTAMAERDRHWRERLDREIKETRAAMEKIWARSQHPGNDDAVSAGLRGMRGRLITAAQRRRILGYRIAVLTLLLALTAAFAVRYPALHSVLAHLPDAASDDRPAGPEPEMKTLPPRGAPLQPPEPASKAAAPETPKAAVRIKKLEEELSAMRARLEAEEKRANTAEYAAKKAKASQQNAVARADRAFRTQRQDQARTIADLKAEIRALRRKLDAATTAAASQLQTAE